MAPSQDFRTTLVIVTATLAGIFAAQTTAAQEYRNNTIPMYDGMEKTSEELETDRRYIEQIVSIAGSREAGSDGMVDVAWAYYFRGDIETAIKRFNQAWLLDPENGDAFHGFAIVVLERDHNPDQANEFFRQGLDAPRQSTAIHVAYGRFLVETGRILDAVPVLRHAVSFPDAGPDAQDLLALALINANDREAFCVEVETVGETAPGEIRAAIRAILDGGVCQ